MKMMLLAILLFTGLSTLAAEPCVSSAAALKSAREQYAAADAALNAAWRPLKSTLSAAQFAATLKQQRLWLSYLDAMAAATASGEPFVELATMKQCAEFEISRAEMTGSRTKVLQALVLPAASSWGGIYEDSFGGQINVDVRADGLHFLIDVVRSTAYHTGRIVGVAQIKGNSAVFRTTTEDFSTEAEHDTLAVVLSLTRAGSLLEVKAENAQNFGGMRAYFDGSYVRVSALNKTGAAEIDTAMRERE